MMWSVYGLIDPRGGRVFYIGMTYDKKMRLSQHSSCRESAAWQTIQEIKHYGDKVVMCEFASFGSEESARLLESALISVLPNILNRTHFYERDEFQKRLDSKVQLGDVDVDGCSRLTEEEFLRSDIEHISDGEIEDGFVV